MISPQEYLESMKKMNFRAYILGEKAECPAEYPLVIPAQRTIAATYAMTHDPASRELGTARSHVLGKTVNRFTHIHQSSEDLMNKVKMLRFLGQQTGTCFQRCVGMDAINALSSTAYETDQEKGTEYHQRFLNFL